MSVLNIEYPAWLDPFLAEAPADGLDERQLMALAVDLSRRNIESGGGPFAALVCERGSGRIVAAGVNRVTASGYSLAHAEMLAISLAQQRLGQYRLQGDYLLVSSCEPCAMCFGAIPWSGITRLVCGAPKAAAEAAGFDEGPKPHDWSEQLRQRGIEVVTGVLAEQAAAVLEDYAERGEIY